MTVKQVYKDVNGLHRFVIDVSEDSFVVIQSTLDASLEFANDHMLIKDIAIKAPDKLEVSLLMANKLKIAIKEIELKDKK